MEPPKSHGSGPPDQPHVQNSTADASLRWAALVERIRAGDNSSVEELYATFARGIRYYLCRHLGAQELDDKVHDTFLIVLQSIRNGSLREPERLMGFVRTIVRRQVASFIEEAVQSRRDHTDVEVGTRVPDSSATPEKSIIDAEKQNIMYEVLRSISPRDREILTRFYLHEQSPEQICSEMSLTETQFRLLKSRAKARFSDLGKKRLTRTPLVKNFLRQVTSTGH
jgi:RNA polymerase sigma-70 factor (ECF subfamily)